MPDPPVKARVQVIEKEESPIEADFPEEPANKDEVRGESRVGGFSEQNVTPAMSDLWADDTHSATSKTKPVVSPKPFVKNKSSNMVTGETFLKDARLIDSSIDKTSAVARHVKSLKKPYNDNEVARLPENANTFQKNRGSEDGAD